MANPETISFDTKAYKQILKEFAKDYPERCRTCHLPSLRIGVLAESVALGEISVEAARANNQEFAADISRNCAYGAEGVGGCFGGSRCNYGLMCRFP